MKLFNEFGGVGGGGGQHLHCNLEVDNITILYSTYCATDSEVAHGIHYIQYFDLQIIFIQCFHTFTRLVYSTRMSQVTGQQVNSFNFKIYIYIFYRGA